MSECHNKHQQQEQPQKLIKQQMNLIIIVHSIPLSALEN